MWWNRFLLSSSAVWLQKGKARLFQEGNPLVYNGAIKEIKGATPVNGDHVLVCDHVGNPVGKGIYNSASSYRVRLFSRSFEQENKLEFSELIGLRIQQALLRRNRHLLLPSSTTTAYRAVNGEGDRLSGLIVDVLGNIAVIQSSALWVEQHRSSIESSLQSILPAHQMIWRQAASRLKQDGVDTLEIPSSSPPLPLEGGHEQQEIVIAENGVQYHCNPWDGQKTGFYCDQRDNRQLIRSLSRNKTVLDTYCYSGGFAINAALGGATKVVAVDSSSEAVAMARRNFLLNQRANDHENSSNNNNNNNNNTGSSIDFVEADAVEYMKGLALEKQVFDIVVCDPPKLAPTRVSLDKARNKYVKINAAALALVQTGGLLLTCSCSGAVTQANALHDILREAARMAKRDVTILSTTTAALDHPVHASYPEGKYLSCILASVI